MALAPVSSLPAVVAGSLEARQSHQKAFHGLQCKELYSTHTQLHSHSASWPIYHLAICLEDMWGNGLPHLSAYQPRATTLVADCQRAARSLLVLASTSPRQLLSVECCKQPSRTSAGPHKCCSHSQARPFRQHSHQHNAGYQGRCGSATRHFKSELIGSSHMHIPSSNTAPTRAPNDLLHELQVTLLLENTCTAASAWHSTVIAAVCLLACSWHPGQFHHQPHTPDMTYT
jgi:hypothetical protein